VGLAGSAIAPTKPLATLASSPATGVPLVTSWIDGHLYAVVSVNAFDGVEPSMLDRAPATFDGEGTGDRLARRQRNWIRSVAFVDAGDQKSTPQDR